MPSAIRQLVNYDPQPGNQGRVASDPKGSGYAFPMAFPIPTLSGSTICVFGCIANLESTYITHIYDDVNSGLYTIAQHQGDTNYGLYTAVGYMTNASALGAGDAGSLTSVSGSVLTDSTKSWTTNQWVGARIVDYSVGPTTVGTVISNTATTLTCSGLAGPGSGDSYTVGDQTWVGLSAYDDYNGVVAIEISGTAASAYINSSSNAGTYTVGQNMSSGAVNMGSAPCQLIGFGVNDTSASSSGPYAPSFNSGEGYSDYSTFWKWNGPANVLHVIAGNFSNPGSMDANFTATAATDHHEIYVIGFLDAGGGSVAQTYPTGSDYYM